MTCIPSNLYTQKAKTFSVKTETHPQILGFPIRSPAPMGKGTTTGGGGGGGAASSHHRQFKDKAKTRVDDLQGMFTDLQLARRESRNGDAALLEAQVSQVLREWKAELDDPTPSNSASSCGIVSEIRRLMGDGRAEGIEELDDATSRLNEAASHRSEPPPQPQPQPQQLGVHDTGTTPFYQEDYYLSQDLTEDVFQSLVSSQYQSTLPPETDYFFMNGHEVTDYQHFELHQETPPAQYNCFDRSGQNDGKEVPHNAEWMKGNTLLTETVSPPATAFGRPKCLLWDCSRPTPALPEPGWYQDYCSDYHADLASEDGLSCNTPILRPGGIELKDGPLFAALSAKIQGKNVGIPECEDATQQSPWNAHDVFDLILSEGETVREWLFFGKRKSAFVVGRRKQRQLTDYKGRGWHESRKQEHKDVGGIKRSYYMDPQPSDKFDWHLFEYQIKGCDVYALYRLEYKVVDAKKGAKAKLTCDPVVDLQQQMVRLNADTTGDSRRSGRAKANQNVSSKKLSDRAYHASNQISASDEYAVYGPRLPG